MPLGTIRLGSDRALIISNSLPNQPVCQPTGKQIDLDSYGLFESATPNFATYYPDITEADLKPETGDFIYPLFRALSEVTVNKTYNPVDFSKNSVLKKSMKLLVGQTIYPNHEQLIGNELGAVKKVEWQEAYTTPAGIKIPAGITAQLMIDGKKVPNIVRSILMDPPAIHSVSVTVTFEWEKSHNLSDDEFYRKLGTYDEQGNMYSRVATKILRYSEISLVPHGADPYAKLVGPDGKIIKPEEAARRDGTLKNAELPTVASFAFCEESLSEQENTIPNTVITNQQVNTNNNMKREHLLMMAFTLGLMETESLSDEDLTKQVRNSMAALKANEAKLIKELAEEKAKTPAALELTEAQKKSISLGDSYLAKLRQEVENTYKLAYPEKVDDATLASIQASDETVLLGLKAQYETKLNEHSPLTCQDCKSHNVSRQTTTSQGEGGGQGKPTTVSAAEAIEKAAAIAAAEGKKISPFEEIIANK